MKALAYIKAYLTFTYLNSTVNVQITLLSQSVK